MPNVLNKRISGSPKGAVYIGRPSKWGNPFTHKEGTLAEFKVGSRDEAVDAYERWLLSQPDLVQRVRAELAGRDVVCWCAPARCHGDVLVKVANTPVLGQDVLASTPVSRPQTKVSSAQQNSITDVKLGPPRPFEFTGRFRRTPR